MIAIVGDGLLGQSIAEWCRALDVPHRLLTHADIEVTDPANCYHALKDASVAINTAAYHDLTACEQRPDRAEAVNWFGALYVANACREVYVSTDYASPGSETWAPPLGGSIYAQTKAMGERETLDRGGAVVRVGPLFGHYPSHKGRTFTGTILASRDPISLPVDQRFSPTYAHDAAVRIVQIARGLPHGVGAIYHAANDGSCTWAEFGRAICKATGHQREISARIADDPLRPTDSTLRSEALPPLRWWRDALDAWAVREGWA